MALFLVIEGGLVFALGMFVLGGVCMHELYGMYERAQPARLAGFIALAGLLAAALYGDQFQVLLVAVIALPLLFGLTLAQPRPRVGGDGAHAARDLLDRLRPRPRGPAARAAARARGS